VRTTHNPPAPRNDVARPRAASGTGDQDSSAADQNSLNPARCPVARPTRLLQPLLLGSGDIKRPCPASFTRPRSREHLIALSYSSLTPLAHNIPIPNRPLRRICTARQARYCKVRFPHRRGLVMVASSENAIHWPELVIAPGHESTQLTPGRSLSL
jgi:hypothetical protein